MLDFKNVNHYKIATSQILFGLLGYVCFAYFQRVKSSRLELGISAHDFSNTDLLILSLLGIGFCVCWGTVLSLTPIHFLKR